MRTPVDLIVTAAALKQLSDGAQQRGTDLAIEEMGEAFELKNVCAKVDVSLSNRIDGIVWTLGISKRAFLEAAMIEACDKADSIIESEGLNDYLAEVSAAIDKAEQGGV